ncbi:hypothetical protein AGLY_008299 [Aphis glycines]|uniref:Uncharacterized protein n=1 Tax=Aphis glycines TaxID=307491 RepID=A0A6G0TM04_APHGL|nr:hypothetical protein AGLY_008299 [Aphis glycines]
MHGTKDIHLPSKTNPERKMEKTQKFFFEENGQWRKTEWIYKSEKNMCLGDNLGGVSTEDSREFTYFRQINNKHSRDTGNGLLINFKTHIVKSSKHTNPKKSISFIRFKVTIEFHRSLDTQFHKGLITKDIFFFALYIISMGNVLLQFIDDPPSTVSILSVERGHVRAAYKSTTGRGYNNYDSIEFDAYKMMHPSNKLLYHEYFLYCQSLYSEDPKPKT